MMRRLSLAVLLFVAGCTTPPPAYMPADASASTAAPQVKVGDYWEYSVRDGWTALPRGNFRYEVISADANGTVVRLTQDGLVLDTFVYGPGWNPREAPLPNTQRFRYSPNLTNYEYPLAPGKTWSTVVRSTDVVTGHTFN